MRRFLRRIKAGSASTRLGPGSRISRSSRSRASRGCPSRPAISAVDPLGRASALWPRPRRNSSSRSSSPPSSSASKSPQNPRERAPSREPRACFGLQAGSCWRPVRGVRRSRTGLGSMARSARRSRQGVGSGDRLLRAISRGLCKIVPGVLAEGFKQFIGQVDPFLVEVVGGVADWYWRSWRTLARRPARCGRRGWPSA